MNEFFSISSALLVFIHSSEESPPNHTVEKIEQALAHFKEIEEVTPIIKYPCLEVSKQVPENEQPPETDKKIVTAGDIDEIANLMDTNLSNENYASRQACRTDCSEGCISSYSNEIKTDSSNHSVRLDTDNLLLVNENVKEGKIIAPFNFETKYSMLEEILHELKFTNDRISLFKQFLTSGWNM